MTGFSDYYSKAVLNHASGLQPMPAVASRYLALFTAVGSDAGTGFTEVSAAGYARQQIAGSVATNGTTSTSSAVLNFASVPSWIVAGMSVYDSTTPSAITGGQTVLSTTSTTVTLSGNVNATVGSGDTILFSAFAPASGSSPSSTTNSGAAVTMSTLTAAGGTGIAWGIYDASSSGNLIDWDYLGNYPWLPAYVTSASPGVIDAKGHGYSNGDSFVFSTEYGGTAPSFSAGNYNGVLTVAGVSGDTFNVTGVNTSSTGSGAVRKVLQQVLSANTQPVFNTSTFTIQLA